MNSREANKEFPFAKIVLTNPIAIREGTSFSKMTIDDKPICIQLPKTTTKTGLITTRRDCYTDLMYSINNETLLVAWIASLERTCKDKINERKTLWFSTGLKTTDIEGMLTPVSRPYRGDSLILVRVAIDASKNSGCQIYDDLGNKIDESIVITSDHNIIPLVLVEGIKFSSKSIDIVITLSQVMVFSPEKKVTDCLINHKSNSEKKMITAPEHIPFTNSQIKEKLAVNLVDKISNSTDAYLGKEIKQDFSKSILEEVDIHGIDDINLGEISELPDHDYNNSYGLREIDITDNNEGQSIILKNPSEIYYEIYRVAKEKAIQTKLVAVEAYLEAKQIKTKFNIFEPKE